MKKSILTLVMSAFFLVGLTSMLATDPPVNTTCNDQCEFLVSVGIFDSHGDCMGACNTCINPSESAATAAVCECNLIDEIYGDVKNVGFKNFGDCVKYFKNLFS